MLEKPDLKDEVIIDCLHREYGIKGNALSFLPLGADQKSAVYRVAANLKRVYFAKLRSGEFDESAVTVPKYLYDLGIQQIIPPLATQSGRLWACLPPYKVILYPYVDGRNGFERKLSITQWKEFGAALKRFHAADIPQEITHNITREKFSTGWHDSVKRILERVCKNTYVEPVASETAAFMKAKSGQTLKIVARAEALARPLQKNPPEFILCHADIHGWNLLIDNDGALYMVDWDTLIFAPKERDLMFIGGGLGDSGYTPQEEEALFYKGYGQTDINSTAIAYYRYERIIEDLAVYCEPLLLSDEGGEDRKQSLVNLKSNYLPCGTIERAFQSDRMVNNYRE
jgi:spectinomycin phosphotransferase